MPRYCHGKIVKTLLNKNKIFINAGRITMLNDENMNISANVFLSHGDGHAEYPNHQWTVLFAGLSVENIDINQDIYVHLCPRGQWMMLINLAGNGRVLIETDHLQLHGFLHLDQAVLYLHFCE